MRKLFHLQLWIWFCYIPCHYTSGLQLDLTRSQTGDYFNNPYSTSCDDDNKRFCDATNSICYQNHPHQENKCCYCRCQVTYSTFNLTSFRCAPNSEFRPDQCFYRFGGDRRYDGLYAIDMTVTGDKELMKRGLDDKSQKNLKNCVVNKVEQMNSKGYEKVASYPFSINNKKHSFDLEWTRSDGNSVHGRVYRITLTCKYKYTSFTGCLMFKSAGTVQVYHPDLPEISSASSISTPISIPSLSSSSLLQSSSLRITEITSTTQLTSSPERTVSSSFSLREILRTSSTDEEFIKPSSTFVVNSPSSTQWFIHLQSSVEEERAPSTKSASSTINNYENPKETMAPSSSSIMTEFPTSPEKERQSSKKDRSVMVYIIVIVVCVVIIALVVVLFITKRKKKTVLKKRQSQANIILSDMNKNNVDEDQDGHYTSLDKSARNDESNYEALRFPGTDKNQPRADDETMHQNDNVYAYADTDRLYSTIVDDGKLGAKINDAFDANKNERVYSILEQQSGQIDYTTQNKQNDSERVYSVLETEPDQISFPTPSANSQPAGHGYTGNLDVDYVTVVPPESEPSQSDCSVYADLSAQRDAGENQYQSLVKKKE